MTPSFLHPELTTSRLPPLSFFLFILPYEHLFPQFRDGMNSLPLVTCATHLALEYSEHLSFWNQEQIHFQAVLIFSLAVFFPWGNEAAAWWD